MFLEEPRLFLFFTQGVSLHTWASIGMLDREVAIYRSLIDRGMKVSFITYGNTEDLELGKEIPEIEIFCNHMNLPRVLYDRFLHRIHGEDIREADVIKSNQTRGADIALRSARYWGKPFISRSGYIWSNFAARSESSQTPQSKQAQVVEAKVFSGADRVVVTTPAMREYVIQQYSLEPEKIRVVPNYVLTDLFCPGLDTPVRGRLCFVGRFDSQKNPLLMVEACAGLDVELIMVGDGPLKEQIEDLANRLGVNLHLLGNLPHDQLPGLLNSSEIFLLLSQYEGHPKVLLEAMSCGLTVIGANSPGIRELITHRQNGLLAETNPGDVRATIEMALSNPDLRSEIGEKASQFVLDHYSLDQIADLEVAVIDEVLAQKEST